jgi:hypothetical protein
MAAEMRLMAGGRPRRWDSEEVAFLLWHELSPEAIAARFGVTPGAIARTLQREGEHVLARPFDRAVRAARRGQ